MILINNNTTTVATTTTSSSTPRHKSIGKWSGGGLLATKKNVACGILIVIAINCLFTTPSQHVLDSTNHIKRELTMDEEESSWSCKWSPYNFKQCDQLFAKRLSEYTNKGSKIIEGDHAEQSSPAEDDDRGQRWLFFGDSTMKRLYNFSYLKKVLVEDALVKARAGCLGPGLACQERKGDRCELNANFGLPNVDKWVPPDEDLWEGPTHFGRKNAYCSDCSGCQTHFLDCKSVNTAEEVSSISKTRRALSNEEQTLAVARVPRPAPLQCKEHQEEQNGGLFYGGYMMMEFARDTEIQTPEFRTTQENIAAYIMRNWNSPDMLKHWKKPICVLGAGNHDILIDGITTEDFVRNVKFMLTTMKPACEHMIWLGNTTNGKESEYLQTMKQMKIFDRGVKEMLESEPELLGMMSFLDVIDASLTFPHADYIHMDDNWYSQLGKWFITLM